MQKCVWGGLLCPLVCLGLFQLNFAEPLAAQTATSSEVAAATVAAATDESVGPNAGATSSEDANRTTPEESARLKDISDRIVVGDQENLKKFIALMTTLAGQIVMADRAAP